MNQVSVININSPFLDQKPGTSGLRTSTLKFQEEHYLEIFIEAILQSLEDLKGSTLVVGGDGRYGNIEAIEKIVQICICLLYTSPSPRDEKVSRMPSSA